MLLFQEKIICGQIAAPSNNPMEVELFFSSFLFFLFTQVNFFFLPNSFFFTKLELCIAEPWFELLDDRVLQCWCRDRGFKSHLNRGFITNYFPCCRSYYTKSVRWSSILTKSHCRDCLFKKNDWPVVTKTCRKDCKVHAKNSLRNDQIKHCLFVSTFC